MPNQALLTGVAAGGGYAADQPVMSAIRNASLTTGTRFDTLLTTASIESGLNPSAQASTSSASGLFQFTEQTWLSTVRQFGAAHGLASEAAAVVQRGGRLTVEDPALKQRILNLRTDAATASTMAGEYLQGLSQQLGARIGHAPDATETYLGHFLGTGGAAQMLNTMQSTPDRPAANVLPAAAGANPTMFYAKDGTPYTAKQFVQHIGDRVAKTYVKLGYAMPQGSLDFAGHAVAGQSADPPGAGAAGWGTSTPKFGTSEPGRMMLASLAEVFTQIDRSSSRSPESSNKRDHRLPPGIVSALEASSGSTPLGPITLGSTGS